jgi:hypothetical protein
VRAKILTKCDYSKFLAKAASILLADKLKMIARWHARE